MKPEVQSCYDAHKGKLRPEILRSPENMSSEEQTKEPTASDADVLVHPENMKKERFGFAFYMTLGLLVVVLSFPGPLGPPAGNTLMNLVAAFCGLQAYLRHEGGLQRVSSFLLFAIALGLLLSPFVAGKYVEWIRR